MLGFLISSSAIADAKQPLSGLVFSLDVETEIAGVSAADQELFQDHLEGAVSPLSLGLPTRADLNAFSRSGSSLDYSIDVTVELGDLTVEPRDVVRAGNPPVFVLDGSAVGVPSNVDIDAVSRLGNELVISFATSVDLDGAEADDEDLVLWDGVSFQVLVDGSAAGVPPAADLDAAHYLAESATWLLSFDISGTIGGISFDDEDVVAFAPDTGIWELEIDFSERFPSMEPGGIDGLWADTAFFRDGFESGDTSAWSMSSEQ